MGDSKPSVSKLDNVKKIIKSLVLSSREGLTSDVLSKEYISTEGKQIPFFEFGYPNLNAFLRSIPDTVRTQQNGNKLIISRVVTKESEHITKLVDQQNKNRSDRNRRKSSASKNNSYMNGPMPPPPRNTNNTYLLPTPPLNNISNIPSLLDINVPSPLDYFRQQRTNFSRQNQQLVWQNQVRLQQFQHHQQMLQQHIQQEQMKQQFLYQQLPQHPHYLQTNHQPLPQQQHFQQQLNTFAQSLPWSPPKLASVNLHNSSNQRYQPNTQQNGNHHAALKSKEELPKDGQRSVSHEESPKTKDIPSTVNNLTAEPEKDQFKCNNKSARDSNKDVPTYNEFLDEFDDLSINVEHNQDTVDHVKDKTVEDMSFHTNGSSLGDLKLNQTDNTFNSKCVSSSAAGSNSSHNSSVFDSLGEYDEVEESIADPGTRYENAIIPSELKVGSLNIIVVSEVTSPHKFWIHTNGITQDLIQLMTDIERYYTSITSSKLKFPLDRIQSNEACVVLYNNVWHRAEILNKVSNDVVRVDLVDYGTKTNINLKQVNLVLKEFTKLPKQAVQASLSSIRPVGECWTDKNIHAFVSMIKDLFLYAKVTELDKSAGIVHVELIDTNKQMDILITSELVKKDHVRYC